jgi:hypothetical protein
MTQMVVDSTIERRLLVNYRIDPGVVARLLPWPFRPQLVNGWAIGGICMIRLSHLRPALSPVALGPTTENMAHRFGVEWGPRETPRTGVFIPRRDTSSALTAVAGGRIFAGLHGRARFEVLDEADRLDLRIEGISEPVRVEVATHPSQQLGGSLFESVADAVDFFRRSPIGYSPNARRGVLEGMRLECPRWDGSAVSVDRITSSVFDDEAAFPPGSCAFDSALVMRRLAARWHTVRPMRLLEDPSVALPGAA